MNKSLLAAAMFAAALLAACDSKRPAQLSEVVQEAFANTSETALPIDINALDLDTSDESPTMYDYLLI